MTASRHCCLIAEDQILLGMSLEAYLAESGFEVAGCFLTNAQALRWLEDNTPDIAVLDVLLKDGPCVPLARVLKARGVPFAIYSGLPPAASSPPELQNVPWLKKPVSRESLASTLQQLTASAGTRESRSLLV